VVKQNERHRLKRFVMARADVAKVAEHRERLMHALDEFGVMVNLLSESAAHETG